MAGPFTPGQQTTTTNPSQPSAASAALKLFIIQLLMSRLQQTGGAPQTFGNYLSGGPRKMDTNQLGAGLPDLMKVLQQPGAFNAGPQVQKTQPSSPSLFQDLAGLAPLGALGYQIYKGAQPDQNDALNKLLIAKILGINQGSPNMGGGFPSLGATDQIGMTMDPSYGQSPMTSDLFTNGITDGGFSSSY